MSGKFVASVRPFELFGRAAQPRIMLRRELRINIVSKEIRNMWRSGAVGSFPNHRLADPREQMKENISKRPSINAKAWTIKSLSIFAGRQKSLLALGLMVAVTLAAVAIRAAEPVIGILPKTISGDVFMKNMSDAAVAKGKALGAKVEVYSVSSHEAVEEQVSAVESLISRKVDAIILAAVDSKGLAPVVDKATAAGIPVILADSGEQGASYVTVVQTDNIAASSLAADYAAALLSQRGKVAQLEGEPASETAQLRKKGFHEELAKYKNIQLVSSIIGHWTTPGAVEATWRQ
jgi:ABC-type sugar transport system substrate-binding protein